ncbi:acetyltransferase [soil metagenome]
MKKLLIVGTGDYAVVAYHFISTEKLFEVVGFSEELVYIKNQEISGIKNFPFEQIEKIFAPGEVEVLVAVGPNKVNMVRERLYNEVKQKGFRCIKYISPDATVWDREAVGENSFIFPRCVVEPFAKIGNNTVMWAGSMVAHHSEVKDHCFLAPGVCISGRTVVNNNCFIGINATIRDNLVIAERCIIGGGAVIKKNTVAEGVYSANGTTIYKTGSFNTKV